MTSALRPTNEDDRGQDVIEQFYDRRPYPPPDDLDAVATPKPQQRRAAHHLVWPGRPYADRSGDSRLRILVAGCGTSQAARHAITHPDADVVGIDVSSTGIEQHRQLIERHRLANLELHRLPIEEVAGLDRQFDHIVCTGVLHHLADPLIGLRSLQSILAPGGALTLMVYATYGRAGVYLIQDYCLRLGIGTDQVDLDELVATLREIGSGHPISRLLHQSRDFADDDALADALLNPRDRSYTVPQLLELITDAGLRFGRWQRQAPYLPDCGSISETPHSARIAKLPVAEQYAALELFRGTITRHTAIAYAATDSGATTDSGPQQPDFADPAAGSWRPIRVPTAIAVTERLPPGAAGALLNRAHTETDLVSFVNAQELIMFRRIDGSRTVADLGPQALGFVERLFRHDLIVLDTCGASEQKGDRS
ncbi:class I SAM-dependent methyltransferase [Microlunatus elymi]|uniref:Class I SAM-dependent methyltransferase n=1 Tax=Microlunatus elymi TaxID=2596828 RepID=A0A516PZA2_9ACTN|nr:class I SAM-dependent methyltransferase [Microlunatus elymi]QDP96482.1 class I SAM-dependent methyltransferase [Microlunatus elymi]